MHDLRKLEDAAFGPSPRRCLMAGLLLSRLAQCEQQGQREITDYRLTIPNEFLPNKLEKYRANPLQNTNIFNQNQMINYNTNFMSLEFSNKNSLSTLPLSDSKQLPLAMHKIPSRPPPKPSKSFKPNKINIQPPKIYIIPLPDADTILEIGLLLTANGIVPALGIGASYLIAQSINFLSKSIAKYHQTSKHRSERRYLRQINKDIEKIDHHHKIENQFFSTFKQKLNQYNPNFLSDLQNAIKESEKRVASLNEAEYHTRDLAFKYFEKGQDDRYFECLTRLSNLSSERATERNNQKAMENLLPFLAEASQNIQNFLKNQPINLNSIESVNYLISMVKNQEDTQSHNSLQLLYDLTESGKMLNNKNQYAEYLQTQVSYMMENYYETDQHLQIVQNAGINDENIYAIQTHISYLKLQSKQLLVDLGFNIAYGMLGAAASSDKSSGKLQTSLIVVRHILQALHMPTILYLQHHVNQKITELMQLTNKTYQGASLSTLDIATYGIFLGNQLINLATGFNNNEKLKKLNQVSNYLALGFGLVLQTKQLHSFGQILLGKSLSNNIPATALDKFLGGLTTIPFAASIFHAALTNWGYQLYQKFHGEIPTSNLILIPEGILDSLALNVISQRISVPLVNNFFSNGSTLRVFISRRYLDAATKIAESLVSAGTIASLSYITYSATAINPVLGGFLGISFAIYVLYHTKHYVDDKREQNQIRNALQKLNNDIAENHKLSDNNEIINLCEKRLQKNVDDIDSMMYLAFVHLKYMHLNDSENYFKTLLHRISILSKKACDILLKKNYSELEDMCEEYLITIKIKNARKDLYEDPEDVAKIDDKKEMITICENRLKEKSCDLDAMIYLAFVHFKYAHYNQSKTYFKNILSTMTTISRQSSDNQHINNCKEIEGMCNDFLEKIASIQSQLISGAQSFINKYMEDLEILIESLSSMLSDPSSKLDKERREVLDNLVYLEKNFSIENITQHQSAFRHLKFGDTVNQEVIKKLEENYKNPLQIFSTKAELILNHFAKPEPPTTGLHHRRPFSRH